MDRVTAVASNTMGGCFSRGSGQLLEGVDGGEEDYHKRFLEDDVIGEGEFGQVRLVHDVRQQSSSSAATAAPGGKERKAVPYACKVLRKGITFRDNTIYSPIRPDVLKGEVEILRLLEGQQYCLGLAAVYETPRAIYLVTEYCGGGAMTEYVASQPEDLRTEDVSRIAFQLLSAVDHCARHRVLHRDIKPENGALYSFQYNCFCGGLCLACGPRGERDGEASTVSLWVSRWSCGLCVSIVLTCALLGHCSHVLRSRPQISHAPHRFRLGLLGPKGGRGNDCCQRFKRRTHRTHHLCWVGFLHIARNVPAVVHPENGRLERRCVVGWDAGGQRTKMVFRCLTHLMYFWIPPFAGVTLYVLAAGYPANELQRAFNILQMSKGRDLRSLPNLPPDMPDSYYEMLEGLLTYRYKRRPSAHDMLQCEFVRFHQALENPGVLSFEEVALAAHSAAAEAGAAPQAGVSRDRSQHRTASIRLTGSVGRHGVFLDFKRFERSLTTVLVTLLSKAQLEQLAGILQERINQQLDAEPASGSAAPSDPLESKEPKAGAPLLSASNEQKLGVILIHELKAIVRDQLRCDQAAETMDKIPNEHLYANFAYHAALLDEFLTMEAPGGDGGGGGRRRLKRTLSFSHGLKPGVRAMTGSSTSVRSASSLRGGRGLASLLHPSHAAAASADAASADAAAAPKARSTVHGSSVFLNMRHSLVGGGGGGGSGSRQVSGASP